MSKAGRIFKRLQESAVVWSWALNGVRLASGILLLPLLLHKLPKPELGMYYVFLSVIGLQQILDFGFSSAIARFVSYALAGATTLRAQGFVPANNAAAGPNLVLLWQLLRTTRRLYGYLAILGCLAMGLWGTVLVHSKVKETGSPLLTWLAWGLTLAAATLDIYSLWWNTFLYCLNRVRQSASIGFFAYTVRVLGACALLLAGAGLMSVPLATILGCILNRFFSRRDCLQALGQPPSGAQEFSQASLLALLWPNSWRLGLQLFSNYLRTNANTAICVAIFGLAATAEYGLSVQVMGIALGMAGVWTTVKWPVAGQYRAAHDLVGLRRMLWPRLWLQILTFLALAVAAIVAGPTLLQWIRTDKQMLPSAWLVLLLVGFLLDMHFVFWGTLLSLENRIPTLWPTVATNVACLGLAFGLSRYSSLGMLGLVLAPLLSGLVFNYWYWPLAAARSLGIGWFRFIFTRPKTQAGRQ